MANLKSLGTTAVANVQASESNTMRTSVTSTDRAVGVISQTLHPSPTIKWILPARIRHQDHNDVAFVGENFIQLREYLPNGQLANVTAKIDLGSQIWAAKVTPTKAEPSAFIDAIIKQELIKERVSGKDSPYMDKAVEEALAEEKKTGITADTQDCKPPQLLIVSLASAELLFLYAKNNSCGEVHFVFAKKLMLDDTALPDRYGTYLAIDHESRAMAVAPATGYCRVMSLKPIREIAKGIDSWHVADSKSFEPADHAHVFTHDGLISHMDFLPPPAHHPDRVILILLVSQTGGMFLMVYTWDVRQGLQTASPAHCSGQRLPLQDRYPLMFIPSTNSTSFTLVTESRIVVYDDILLPHSRRISLPLSDHSPPRYENSTRTPLWVQWTKPPRTFAYNKTHDDIYLVREDGMIRYYIVDRTSPTRIDAHFKAGHLHVNVDTAFASLAAPPDQGGDIMIVGGDMTDGGVFHCQARSPPVCTQIIPNLAPIHDMLTISVNEYPGAKALLDPDTHERVFVCSGKGTGHTAVSELLYGIEAQIGLSADYPELSSVGRIWSLTDTVNEQVIILLSYAQHSSATLFSVPTLELEVATTDSCPGLDFRHKTLAATTLKDHFAIQVTTKGVFVADLSSDYRACPGRRFPSDLVNATINIERGIIVVAAEHNQGAQLQLCSVGLEDGAVQVNDNGRSLKIKKVPVSLSCFDFKSESLLAVGYGDGSLGVYVLAKDNEIKLLSEIKFEELCPDGEACAMSGLRVIEQPNIESLIALCGFRNGYLACCEMVVSKSGSRKGQVSVTSRQYHVLGQTSVDLLSDPLDQRSTFVHCGRGIWRLVLFDGFDGLDHSLKQIWLTSGEDQSYQQPVVHALARMNDSAYLEQYGLKGSLICATGEQLLVSSFVGQHQLVTRQMKTKGNSRCLSYSKYHNQIVVALDHVTFDEEQSLRNLKQKRVIRPCLQFISLDNSVASPACKNTDSIYHFGAPGEKITSLLIWTPSDGQKHYQFIVAGTRVPATDDGPESGQMICVGAKQVHGSAILEVTKKYGKKFPGRPVHSLCAFQFSSLLVGAGTEVQLLQLDMTTKKLTPLTKITLPSAANGLSSHGGSVFVATELHSLITLELTQNQLTVKSFDQRGRSTSKVSSCENNSTVVTTSSSSGGNLVGFSNGGGEKDCEVLFDAAMPLSATGIRAGFTFPSIKGSRRCFYAATLNGTMYYLTTLNQAEWRLLRFVEDMMTPTEVKSQLRSGHQVLKTRYVGRPPSKPKATQMHIKGDIIGRLLENDCKELRESLSQSSNRSDVHHGISSSGHRYQHFRDLAKDVLGDTVDPVASVASWVRKFIRERT